MITGLSSLSGLTALGGRIEAGSSWSSSGTAAAGQTAGNSFAALLDRTAGSAIDTLHGAENSAVRALQGDGDMRTVVDQVMSAEQSLQAAVAIRDKIVAAYLEVSRMAI